MKRITDYGFKLGEEKSFLPKVKYLEQIIDKNGRRPDPSRADAIKNMPLLTNVITLQSFWGLANYYQIYIPNMHKVRAPLKDLLKKDVKWNWSDMCQKAFDEI